MSPRAWIGGPSSFGPAADRVAMLAAALGLIAIVAGILAGEVGTALGALAGAWLFCAGLAAGTVAVSAAVRVVGGRWGMPVLPVAEAPARFFGPALALLFVILVGARAWMPESAVPGVAGHAWLVGRNLIVAALLMAAGRRYIARSRALAERREGGAPAAVIYLLLYVTALTLWVADLAMGLRPGAPSSILPVFYFMGAFLGGIAWVALTSTGRDAAVPASARHDLGNMLFAFAAFWAYLAWCAYLPVWYENMPEETGFLFARWEGAWRYVTIAMLIAVFWLPFLLFFPEARLRGRVVLRAGAAIILLGLLAQALLLVLPSLPLRGDWLSALLIVLITAGVWGLFVLVVGRAAIGKAEKA